MENPEPTMDDTPVEDDAPTLSKGLDVEIAGAGCVVTEALEQIAALCDEMDELAAPFHFLSQGFTKLVAELATREAAGTLPTTEEIAPFPALVGKYLHFLTRFKDFGAVSRLLRLEKTSAALQKMCGEFTALTTALGMGELWTPQEKTQWQADVAAAAQQVRAIGDDEGRVLRELCEPRTQIEAMTQLKYALERPVPPSADTVAAIRRVYAAIAQECATAVQSIPSWYVPSDDVEFEAEPFAQGSFGSVHRGSWTTSEGATEKVVVKRLLLGRSGISESVKERFIDEVSLWSRLEHANVLRLFGASHVSSPPFFVCAEAAHGNLAAYLAASRVHRRHMWQLLFGAAQGLAYIHKNFVVHGDLKLNNILVDAQGVAQVADFGLSFVRPSAQSVASVQPLPTDDRRAGGLRWRAPECLKKRPTYASDVYSFAMCIVEAATNEPPYAALDDELVHRELKLGNIPPRPRELTDDAWVLVQAMAQFEPSGRLSMAEVLAVLEDFAQTEIEENKKNLCVQCEQKTAEHEGLCCECRLAEETRSGERASSGTPLAAPSSPRGRRNTGSTPGASIVPLVQLLRAGTPDQMHYAAHALGDLAADSEDNRRDIVKAGGIALLAGLQQSGSDTLKDEAHRVLRLLASDGETCVLIANAGCVSMLLELLHGGSPSQKQAVAFALSAFLSGGSSSTMVVDASAMKSLVLLLGAGNDGQKMYAAKALSMLAQSHGADPVLSSEAVVVPLVKLVQSGNDDQSLHALRALASLSVQRSVCSMVASANGVRALVAQLETLGEDHQLAALDVLVRLAEANDFNCSAIGDAGGVAPLVELLRRETGELKRLAAEIIERLATCGGRLCESLVESEVVAPLVDMLAARGGADGDTGTLGVARTLGSLAKNVPASGNRITAAGGVPPLVALSQQHDDAALEDAANAALRALVQDDESCLAIAESGGFAIVFDVLRVGDARQKSAALFTVAVSFAKDSDPAASAHVRRLEPLVGFLRTGSAVQKQLAAATFATLASIGLTRASLLRANIVAPLVALVADNAQPRAQALAAGVLAQLAGDGDEAAAAIIASGGIDALAEFLLAGELEQGAVAAGALAHLACEPPHCAAIAAHGVVPHLVRMLQASAALQSERAAFLLARLAQDATVHAQVAASGGVPLLAALVQRENSTAAQKEHAAATLGLLLDTAAPSLPQDALACVATPGLLAALVTLLDAGNDNAKLGAAACVAGVARHAPRVLEAFLVAVAGTHLVPLLISLLRTGVGGQREKAAAALSLCASLNEHARQSIGKTGGIEVLAKLLQSRTESGTRQALPVLTALAPSPAHAAAFQSAKVASSLVALADGPHRLAVLQALETFHAFSPGEAAEVLALAQELLKSGSPDEKDAAAAMVATAAASAAKAVAQRAGFVVELTALVTVSASASSKTRRAALRALASLADDGAARDALKPAAVVEAVVALLDHGDEDAETVEQAERLAVALARNKVMSKETADKWLVPRLEELVARGGGGARADFAREAVVGLKAKRSSFSLGRTRSMSSEQGGANA